MPVPLDPFDPFDPFVASGETQKPAPPGQLPPQSVEPPRRDRVGFDPDAASASLDVEPKPAPDQPADDPATIPPAVEPPAEPPLALDPRPAQRVDPRAAAIRAQRTREAEVDIQAEAERRLAMRAQLAAIKPELIKPDPLEVIRHRDEFKASVRRLAAQDRPVFHAELAQIIKEYGRGAGPDIRALRDRFGVDSIPEIANPANRDLTRIAERLSTTERIRRMRQWGLPETMVLDDLFEQERHNIGSRGGPRNEDEAMVYAARLLLRYPPPVPRANPQPAVGPPSAR